MQSSVGFVVRYGVGLGLTNWLDLPGMIKPELGDRELVFYAVGRSHYIDRVAWFRQMLQQIWFLGVSDLLLRTIFVPARFKNQNYIAGWSSW